MQIPSGEWKKKVEGVNKKMGIFRLDRCMENTNKIRNFSEKSVGLAKHNFHFKKLLKKKKEKSGRYFEHWLLKYHTHYYPSVEIWVIAVWCLGKFLFF